MDPSCGAGEETGFLPRRGDGHLLLAALGGAAGVAMGVLATTVYAEVKGWATVVPALAWGGGLGAAVAIGAVAGLLPSLRAARMQPTEALRAT
ncbi:hypothetical protein [Streptomyces fulvoviolaceus]|uniref:hypothetical protein n=1 Tax=Streptomyces fulvoviolaceus TaxID=285535 RepID=UPI0004C4C42A|nr:hypothetical protein [Streptomyces fulvoviolaceus]MCT9075986.1 hypothetical protein [Streptomyces fulvoviolaceus]